MSLSYLFFGTSELCVSVLDLLTEAGRVPLAVVCQPDRPKGRGCKVISPPTKCWADTRAIASIQPDLCKDAGFLKEIEQLQPDLGLVFAFGQLLPRRLLEIPKLGFINVHPSLLPRYRGAAPIQWALIQGEQVTGVSIVEVTPRLDDGDIILQESVRVDPEENACELGARLALLGAKLVIKTLELIEKGQTHPTPQDERTVVWAPALKKEDGVIKWDWTTQVIHNRIRSVQPWPGATTRLGDKLLKIHRATSGQGTYPEAECGQVVEARGDSLLVRTGDGVLRLLEIQLPGKKRVEARAFLAGRQIQLGDRFL